MNNLWQTYPFLRYTAALFAGILWYAFQMPELPWAYFWLVFFAAAYLLFWRMPLIWRRNASFVWSLLQFPLIFLVGYLLTEMATPSNDESHILHMQDVEAYEVVVVAEPQPKATGTTVVGEARFVRLAGQWQHTLGKVQLFLAKDSTLSAAKVEYGSVLLIDGAPKPYDPPKNPDEFDYRQYQLKQHIYLQQYLRPDGYRMIGQESDRGLFALSIRVRKHLQEVFDTYLGTGQESAIAKALVVGIKSGLDNEIKEAYAGAGAMHVLAVSGLHVGIVLLLLNGLIGRWRRGAVLRRLSYVSLAVTLLWGYAFITGLSPSVVRAVSMFTVFAIAGGLKRHTNVYNNLLIACFCMLCYNPYYIFQVGFQLSYAAVFGIVFLQPKIAQIFEPKNKLLRFAWDMTSVSIAAQLATFPMGLLYFQQFPTYFFLSNLVVVLAAWVIIALGLLLLFTSGLPLLASVIGDGLWWSVYATNQFIYGFDSLPYAVFKNLYISPSELWLIYAMLVCFVAVVAYRKARWVYPLFLLMLVFSGGRLWRYHQVFSQQYVGVFSASKQAHLFFVNQDKAWILADSAVVADPNRLAYHSSGFFNKIGVEEVNYASFEHPPTETKLPIQNEGKNTALRLAGKPFYIFRQGRMPGTVPPGIILLEGKVDADSTALAGAIGVERVILGNTVPYYKVREWMPILAETVISSTNVFTDGAYIEKIR